MREDAHRAFRVDRSRALSALPEFINLLKEGNVLARLSAAVAIRHLGNDGREALPALRQNLEHEDPEVQLGAAIAVANLESNGNDLVHILAAGIKHPDADVQEFAVEEIRRLVKEPRQCCQN